MTLFMTVGVSCSSEKDKEEVVPDPAVKEESWRYFDREIYFPTGVSVSPEMAAAQELVTNALKDLEKSTDLGIDYFIFKAEEDSILQPVTSETSYQGRVWRSFFQIWQDGIFNELTSGKIGTAPDQDVVVALNEKNPREYFVVARLSCFVAGQTCGLATQGQAKALVWRAYGYLIGMRYSGAAFSDILKAGVSKSQETEEARKKFISEFNNQLERTRNAIPPPK